MSDLAAVFLLAGLGRRMGEITNICNKAIFIDNGNLIGFPSEKGRGYVFPSWLTHWVPPHPDKKPRVSVAWNIILRGEYGYAKDFQYAKI